MGEQILIISCLIIILLYLAFVGYSAILWKTINYDLPKSKPFLKVSVIVAARNEEKNLPLLLDSFSKQTYPQTLTEFIIVDDQSDDNTYQYLKKSSLANNLNLIILQTSEKSKTPKKNALNMGINASSGEILLFTDADCSMSPQWIEKMVSAFANSKVNLTFGPIRYENINTLEKFLSIEQAALMGSSLSSLKMHIPSMCNGANMAVRKSAFEEIKGFESSSYNASGDDELLLHKTFTHSPESVRFIKAKEAIVTTIPAADLKELFNQRKRWAGKWEKYTLKSTKAFALFIFLFHTIWILSPILILLHYLSFKVFLAFWIIKALFELVFIQLIMHFLGKRINLPAFLILQIIYSFYVVFFGLISRGGQYKWKERKLS